MLSRGILVREDPYGGHMNPPAWIPAAILLALEGQRCPGRSS